MKNIFASIAMFLTVFSAHASMNWNAVAADPTQIQQLTSNVDALTKVLFETKGEQSVSLDKAWHGIHFLLTGSAWKMNGGASLAILGGKPVGEDLGYGPARVLTPAQVKAIAAALEKETPESLSSRYDLQAMEKEQIYPSIWQREGKEGLRYLLDSYKSLLAFYKRAADNGQAIIIAIT
jgi:hypothetical protein